MSNMKILELYPIRNNCFALQLMDKCPNLESAYIRIESGPLFINESVKLIALQDLVVSNTFTWAKYCLNFQIFFII